MKRIALVNHRYGLEVTGGSELHCRILAEHLKKYFEVDVITSCAFDDGTWANYYAPGIEDINGVCVRRFQTVNNRNWVEYDKLDIMLKNPDHSYEEEIKWIQEQGPFCPDLFDYIHNYYADYEAVIFMTYLYYTTAICMIGIPNALMLPTAHDEKTLYLPHYQRTFSSPKGFIYNTLEEKELIERIFKCGDIPNKVCGVGVEIPDIDNLPDVRGKFNIRDKFIIYAGRIAEGKGCDVLINNFIQFKKRNPSDLKLVLIGKKAMDIPMNSDIIFLGFVEDDEKLALMREAELLAIASQFESLSIVALESLSVGRPILVSSKCPVMKGHCERSNAGFYFDTYMEFEKALSTLLQQVNEDETLQERAKSYVQQNYSWDAILNKINDLINQVHFENEIGTEQPYDDKENRIYHKIQPAFENNNIAVILAADDKYVPILSVAIASIIENATKDYNYDIIILSDGIKKYSRKMVYTLIKDDRNISIRFVEVGYILDKYNFEFSNIQLSRATFLRLIIPDLLEDYEKAIYLDCDIVLNDDIANLYNTNIGDSLIGAVIDPHIAEIYISRDGIKEYINDIIGIKKNYKYFNAGLLLINVKEFCKTFSTDQLFKVATSRKWKWEDQDVLNLLCRDRVYWLNRVWNVLWVSNPYLMEIMKTQNDYFRALKKPSLIHYAGGAMPIDRPYEINAQFFWKYAKQTPYYEILVNKMPNESVNINLQTEIKKKIPKSYIGRKYRNMCINIRRKGIVYTFYLGIYNLKGIFKLHIKDERQLMVYVNNKVSARKGE